MAGFRMHVTTSAVLGCGYAGIAHAGYDVPLDTAIVGGAMCGISGMLPDLDSDHGVPLRETMAFAAAIVPMLLVARFETLSLSYDAMVLAAVSLYFFVRFGVTHMIRRYTVHRGMFHSVPAGLIFAGVAFMLSGAAPLEIRCYKAGGVLAGFMSHLLLDEIYAVEWKGGRWRFKKSFGTALKFWGDDAWSNFSTYAKLVIVVMMILGEPTVLERVDARHPGFAQHYEQLQHQFGTRVESLPSPQDAFDAARTAVAPLVPRNAPPEDYFTPPVATPPTEWPPIPNQGNYGTAQRPAPHSPH